MAEKFPEAKGILVNSFTCLESRTHLVTSLIVLRTTVSFGLPCRTSGFFGGSSVTGSGVCTRRIMRWLYICFGILEAPQIKEIAKALDFSGLRFLWKRRGGWIFVCCGDRFLDERIGGEF
ncbi:unnamed protein product [Arabis nemorensis]|uniref:Uncharacterized protein n=1 Tax=Arabis nemorensis TaxID=586526 RepID=A0A565AM35_9BRAS|nr:unnamed protein product [Arabis nemorensis]